jgi:hypothetical protein
MTLGVWMQTQSCCGEGVGFVFEPTDDQPSPLGWQCLRCGTLVWDGSNPLQCLKACPEMSRHAGWIPKHWCIRLPDLDDPVDDDVITDKPIEEEVR